MDHFFRYLKSIRKSLVNSSRMATVAATIFSYSFLWKTSPKDYIGIDEKWSWQSPFLTLSMLYSHAKSCDVKLNKKKTFLFTRHFSSFYFRFSPPPHPREIQPSLKGHFFSVFFRKMMERSCVSHVKSF